jgi:hypothetical protein
MLFNEIIAVCSMVMLIRDFGTYGIIFMALGVYCLGFSRYS